MSNTVLYFTFFNILVQSQSLLDLPRVEKKDILETETAVRNTLNKIFSTLKLQHPLKQRWKNYIKIHDYFFSITLQDYENLNEISRLVQVGNIDNSIQIFITQLNEVLDNDNKSDETEDAVYITLLIQKFLERIEHLKETFGIKSNSTNFDINKTIIKILDSKETLDNITLENETNDTDSNVSKDPEFWESNGRRIFQGKRVSIKEFPFMASIHFFKKFQCAGSIIKSDIIITSASCLQLAYNNRFYRENPAFLTVMIGSRFYEVGYESIPVLEIYFYPNYNPKTLKHNIALIRLLRRINFTKKDERVRKIDFDRRASALPINTNGITVIGWGARDVTNVLENPWKNRLSYAILDFYPLFACQEVYTKAYVTERNFCAGFFSKGGGACNHDAGGPGVVAGILAGVISFGSPICGAPEAPTVFTKVGYYAEWIDEIMDQRIVRGAQLTTLIPDKITLLSPTSTIRPKIMPITTIFDMEKIKGENVTDEEEKIPIKDEELEAVEQSDIFSNFLKTLFENDILEDNMNLDVESHSDNSNDEIETISKTKLNSNSKSKVRTSKPKTASKYEISSESGEEIASQFYLTTRMIDVHETNPPNFTRASIDLFEETKSHDRKGPTKEKERYKYVQREETDTDWQQALEKFVNQIEDDSKEGMRQKYNFGEGKSKGLETELNNKQIGRDIKKKKVDVQNDESDSNNETEQSVESDGTKEVSDRHYKDSEEYDESNEGLEIESVDKTSNDKKCHGENCHYDYDNEGEGSKDISNNNDDKDRGNSKKYGKDKGKLQVNILAAGDEISQSGKGDSEEVSLIKRMKKLYSKNSNNDDKHSESKDHEEYGDLSIPVDLEINTKSEKFNDNTEKIIEYIAGTDDLYELLSKVLENEI